MAKRFRGQNYQSVPQNRAPHAHVLDAQRTQKPPFYNEIDAASQWAHDSELWAAFVRDVVQMPETMTPAVQEAIRQQRWKIAPNPLASIRTAAHQEAKRMGLT